MKTKAKLRESALNERLALSHAEYLARNQSLSEQLLAYIEQSNFKSIHFFLSIVKNNEPDFKDLFPALWNDGRKIMVSKTHLKQKTLSHYWLEPSTVLKETSWGIPEPTEAVETSIENAELIVVPLLLADRSGHRLGYGGGFYDKMLKKYKGATAGVSLFPPVENLPVMPWDVPLQKIFFA